MTVDFPRGFSRATLALAPIMGAGLTTVFIMDNPSFSPWFYVPVYIVLVGAIPFLAGLLSPRPYAFILFPVSVLASLSVGFAVYGVDADVEPISYTLMLTLIYGGLASVGFLIGWTLRGHEFINRPHERI